MITKLSRLSLVLAVTLFGCGHPAPTGQVVAVIDGDEVTLNEILAEGAAQGLTDANDRVTQQRLLRIILERKVLVREAKRERLDRQADFVLGRRRAEEILLADAMMRFLTASVETPTERDVNRFMHDHPFAYAKHVIFRIDQIGVKMDKQARTVQRLAKTGSLESVAQALARVGVVGQRSTTEWDSTFMPAPLITKLQKLPPGTSFVYSRPDKLIVGNVLGQRTVLRSYADRVALARQDIYQQRVEDIVEVRMQAIRRATIIGIQKKFL